MALITQDLTTLTAQDVIDVLLGEGVTVTNVEVTGDPQAIGSFVDDAAGQDDESGLGITEGIILSSGNIADATGPNEEDGTSTGFGEPGDPDLDALLEDEGQTTNDAVVLEIDFIPENEQFLFEYVFASEEYNEFANSAFNDIFAFFLNGENIALIPGTTTPVAINNINDTDNSAFFRNNDPSDLETPPFNIEYDGFTTVFAAQSLVTPGVSQNLKIVIADASDSILDSAVFLEQGSLRTLGPSPDATLERNNNDTLSIQGSEGFVTLQFTLTGVEASQINEVGVFVVDDDQGSIGDLTPGEAGYEQLALTGVRTRVLFSGLPEDPAGGERSRILRNYNVEDRLGFYLVSNGTTDEILADNIGSNLIPQPEVFFVFPQQNADGLDHVEVSDIPGGFSLGWEDTLGGGDEDFNDLALAVEILDPNQTNDLPEGARRQGEIQREVIDLSSLDNDEDLIRGANFNIAGEAVFNNTVGLYKVEDIAGTVRDPITGELVQPSEIGYAEAAIRQRFVQFDRNGSRTDITGNEVGDESSGFYAPFIIADGTPEQWLQENPENFLFGEVIVAYFPYIEANPDGFEHVTLLGDNTFGFEDLPLGNTDLDFNDVIMETLI